MTPKVLTPAEVVLIKAKIAGASRNSVLGVTAEVFTLTALCDSHEALRAKVEKAERAYYTTANDIEQSLGNALGYPKYRDDPENFPEATDDSVCVGDHVPESLASEAAAKITNLNAENARLRGLIEGMEHEANCNSEQHYVHVEPCPFWTKHYCLDEFEGESVGCHPAACDCIQSKVDL